MASLLVSPSGQPLTVEPVQMTPLERPAMITRDPDWRLVSPFPRQKWPRVWVWIEEFRTRVMDDFSPQTVEEFVGQRVAMEGQEATFGVERGGELGGLITVVPINPYLVSAHCLFKKTFWGSETTLAAVAEVFYRVFEQGFEKVTSCAYADNHQILALVRKLGGRKEGHLYRNTLRDGKPADQMVLGILKADFLEAMRESEAGAGTVAEEEVQ